MREKYLRGEKPGFEDRLYFESLTEEERDKLIALVEQRFAHSEERLEAEQEDLRVLIALRDLLAASAPDMTLGQALESGDIGVIEVVESIRAAVPDPLAGQKPD